MKVRAASSRYEQKMHDDGPVSACVQYALTRLGCGDAFVARRGMGVHPSIGSVACGKEDKREGGIERRHEMTSRPPVPQKVQILLVAHVRHGCWEFDEAVHGIRNLISLQSPHTLLCLPLDTSATGGCFALTSMWCSPIWLRR